MHPLYTLAAGPRSFIFWTERTPTEPAGGGERERGREGEEWRGWKQSEGMTNRLWVVSVEEKLGWTGNDRGKHEKRRNKEWSAQAQMEGWEVFYLGGHDVIGLPCANWIPAMPVAVLFCVSTSDSRPLNSVTCIAAQGRSHNSPLIGPKKSGSSRRSPVPHPAHISSSSLAGTSRVMTVITRSHPCLRDERAETIKNEANKSTRKY